MLVFVQIHYGKKTVCTDRCSQTWNTEHGQHEVEAVASNQGAADGKSLGLQHPGTLLSGHCRFEAQLAPSEGVAVQCRHRSRYRSRKALWEM